MRTGALFRWDGARRQWALRPVASCRHIREGESGLAGRGVGGATIPPGEVTVYEVGRRIEKRQGPARTFRSFGLIRPTRADAQPRPRRHEARRDNWTFPRACERCQLQQVASRCVAIWQPFIHHFALFSGLFGAEARVCYKVAAACNRYMVANWLVVLAVSRIYRPASQEGYRGLHGPYHSE